MRLSHNSSFRRRPESSIYNQWQNLWTPFFNGVTILMLLYLALFYRLLSPDFCLLSLVVRSAAAFPERMNLFGIIRASPVEKFLPVNFMAVKIRTIDAGKFCFA
jgi:hypothetical protein